MTVAHQHSALVEVIVATDAEDEECLAPYEVARIREWEASLRTDKTGWWLFAVSRVRKSGHRVSQHSSDAAALAPYVVDSTCIGIQMKQDMAAQRSTASSPPGNRRCCLRQLTIASTPHDAPVMLDPDCRLVVALWLPSSLSKTVTITDIIELQQWPPEWLWPSQL